jgi:hypothetical protein
MGLIVQKLHSSPSDFLPLAGAQALVRQVTSGIERGPVRGGDATDPGEFPKFTLFPALLLVKIGT